MRQGVDWRTPLVIEGCELNEKGRGKRVSKHYHVIVKFGSEAHWSLWGIYQDNGNAKREAENVAGISRVIDCYSTLCEADA